MPEYPYTAVCHTKCYWLETLWDVGETYTGDIPPNKHFSDTGVNPNPPPPETVGDDPRSNIELRKALKRHPYNFTVPKSWTRKQMWGKLKDMERSWELDAATNPDKNNIAPCGFIGATNAGKLAHQRKCKKCEEILNQPETEPEMESEEVDDGDSG